MLIRNVLLVALVFAPLASSPAAVSAQSRGPNHRAVGFSADHTAPGQTKNRATKRPFARPLGIAKVFDGRTAPRGIRRRMARAETPSQPETPTEPTVPTEPAPPSNEECGVTIGFDSMGMLVYLDCNGNVVDSPGTE